jgi:hypothetical protein
MIEKWIAVKETEAMEDYREQLRNIASQADRIAKGADLIAKNIPAISDIVESGDYNVELLHASGPGSTKELLAVVTVGKNEKREVYGLEYYASTVSPDRTGFNVSYCTKPEKYRDFSDFYTRTGIWTEIDKRTPKFQKAVGVGLYGLLDFFTEVGNSDYDLQSLLDILKDQIGNLP